MAPAPSTPPTEPLSGADVTAAPAEPGRAPRKRPDNIFFDLLAFIGQNKKWWLAPILIVLLLMTVLVVLAATEAAPFIYTLF